MPMHTVARFDAFHFFLQLDEESRAYLVRLLNDATQKAVKRQGEVICLGFIFVPDLMICIRLPILGSGQVLVLISTDHMFVVDIRFSNASCHGEESLYSIRSPD
jgi:hypothetical protein